MKKLTISLGIIALLAVSCGAPGPEIDSSHVVDEVMGAVEGADAVAATTTTSAAPALEVPEGCELVVELDEYEFEVEVVKCEGDDREPIPVDPNWLGSNDAKQAAKKLREALVTQSSCGQRVSYGELKTLVAEAPTSMSEPLLEAIAALEVGSAHCNKDKDAWAAAMSEAILNLEAFLQAAESETPHDDSEEATP